MDKISVITPVYNTLTYLPQCIESVLTQSHPNLELILVDDGSTDGSGALCDAYAAKDPRVVVIHQENGGQSRARNRALDCATGAYIAFVDSDDFLAPQALEMLWNACKAQGTPISCMQYILTQEDGTLLKKIRPYSQTLTNHQYLKKLLVDSAYITIWNKLYTKQYLQDLRFHGGVVDEDFLFLVDLCIQQTWKMGVVDEVGYAYRQRIGSTVNKPFGQLEIDSLANACYAQERIAQYDPSLLLLAKGHTLIKVAAFFTKVPWALANADYPPFACALREFQACRKDLLAVPLPLKFRVFLLLCLVSIPFAKGMCGMYQRICRRKVF